MPSALEFLTTFANALERFPWLRGRTSLVQLVVPSRVNLPKYRDLKLEIERNVGAINGKYTQIDWLPIRYLYHSIDRTENDCAPLYYSPRSQEKSSRQTWMPGAA
jgi:trehalose-6-phosphate synthase